MFQFLLDCLFPRTSLTGHEGTLVTDSEWKQLQSWPVIVEEAELRRMQVLSLDRIIAASTYESSPLLKLAIQRFKYSRVPALQRDLGQLMVLASAFLPGDNSCVLCPVPLHWTRLFHRGFNQSLLLARIVAKERGFRLQQLLKRTRPTGHQAHRKRAQRLIAVRNAFAIRSTPIPSYVVLVDDIATTGATLDACAEILKKHGATRVEALVIARG